jgi:tRNA nucleotidyltransferase (CCA-adding enzyme)
MIPPLPLEAKTIIETLKQHGFEGYAVGGSVRDIVMGRNTKGWDFTTNATPPQILSLFPDSFYDNQFGTVGIKIYTNQSTIPAEDNTQAQEKKPDDIYEITTYRTEQGYTDNRHPDQITWGTNLNEDLARRDFTINAIAYDGEHVIDPYNGMQDIKERLIRTVGDPDERFTEDALRIMRAVRIAGELGFLIEPQTQLAIRNHTHRLHHISAERIRDELLKMLKSPYAADGILILKNTGILKVILPELDAAFAVPQKSPKRHHIYDVGTHSVMALKHCPSDDPIVRLATLLHDIGKPATYHKDETGLITFYNHEVAGSRIVKHIAQRLRLSKKQSEELFLLVRWHQFTVDERQTDSAIRRFIRRVTKEYLPDMLALRIGDRLGGGALETSWRLELFKKRLEEVQQQPFSIKDLKINGFDVMTTLQITPGPVIGTTLTRLFQEVEEGTLPNEREALLERILTIQNEPPKAQEESHDE